MPNFAQRIRGRRATDGQERPQSCLTVATTRPGRAATTSDSDPSAPAAAHMDGAGFHVPPTSIGQAQAGPAISPSTTTSCSRLRRLSSFSTWLRPDARRKSSAELTERSDDALHKDPKHIHLEVNNAVHDDGIYRLGDTITGTVRVVSQSRDHWKLGMVDVLLLGHYKRHFRNLRPQSQDVVREDTSYEAYTLNHGIDFLRHRGICFKSQCASLEQIDWSESLDPPGTAWQETFPFTTQIPSSVTKYAFTRRARQRNMDSTRRQGGEDVPLDLPPTITTQEMPAASSSGLLKYAANMHSPFRTPREATICYEIRATVRWLPTKAMPGGIPISHNDQTATSIIVVQPSEPVPVWPPPAAPEGPPPVLLERTCSYNAYEDVANVKEIDPRRRLPQESQPFRLPWDAKTFCLAAPPVVRRLRPTAARRRVARGLTNFYDGRPEGAAYMSLTTGAHTSFTTGEWYPFSFGINLPHFAGLFVDGNLRMNVLKSVSTQGPGGEIVILPPTLMASLDGGSAVKLKLKHRKPRSFAFSNQRAFEHYWEGSFVIDRYMKKHDAKKQNEQRGFPFFSRSSGSSSPSTKSPFSHSTPTTSPSPLRCLPTEGAPAATPQSPQHRTEPTTKFKDLRVRYDLLIQVDTQMPKILPPHAESGLAYTPSGLLFRINDFAIANRGSQQPGVPSYTDSVDRDGLPPGYWLWRDQDPHHDPDAVPAAAPDVPPRNRSPGDEAESPSNDSALPSNDAYPNDDALPTDSAAPNHGAPPSNVPPTSPPVADGPITPITTTLVDVLRSQPKRQGSYSSLDLPVYKKKVASSVEQLDAHSPQAIIEKIRAVIKRPCYLERARHEEQKRADMRELMAGRDPVAARERENDRQEQRRRRVREREAQARAERRSIAWRRSLGDLTIRLSPWQLSTRHNRSESRGIAPQIQEATTSSTAALSSGPDASANASDQERPPVNRCKSASVASIQQNQHHTSQIPTTTTAAALIQVSEETAAIADNRYSRGSNSERDTESIDPREISTSGEVWTDTDSITGREERRPLLAHSSSEEGSVPSSAARTPEMGPISSSSPLSEILSSQYYLPTVAGSTSIRSTESNSSQSYSQGHVQAQAIILDLSLSARPQIATPVLPDRQAPVLPESLSTSTMASLADGQTMLPAIASFPAPPNTLPAQGPERIIVTEPSERSSLDQMLVRSGFGAQAVEREVWARGTSGPASLMREEEEGERGRGRRRARLLHARI